MIRRFALYPEETPWWSFADHENLMQAVERFRPQRVLEFGPGASTLAFVEAGVAWVDAYEDDPEYQRRHVERLSAFPNVHLHGYTTGTVPAIGGRYDLAFVDGPRHSGTREPIIELARQCSDVVLCHDADSLHRAFPWLTFERIGTENGLDELGLLL